MLLTLPFGHVSLSVHYRSPLYVHVHCLPAHYPHNYLVPPLLHISSAASWLLGAVALHPEPRSPVEPHIAEAKCSAQDVVLNPVGV